MHKLSLIVFLIFVLLSCACQQPEKEFKIATYNIYFLDDGISAERKQHLQSVINLLDADIIGFQEIASPAALENILPESYQIAMLNVPEEVQEVACAVRWPFRITSYGYVFPDTSFDDAFPRKRDLLQVFVQGFGYEFVVLVHHAKSRRGGRMATDVRREAAAVYMVQHIRTVLAGRNVIVLGDFNDNPDDRSVNILEYGDSEAAAGVDSVEDTFLLNTTEPLADRDVCSYGYSYLFKEAESDTFALSVAGARAENNKWRNREHDFFNDVKVKAILFDQILVSRNLKSAVTGSGVFNQSVAVRGAPSRIRFVQGTLEYTKRGSLASDHVPVWTTVQVKL